MNKLKYTLTAFLGAVFGSLVTMLITGTFAWVHLKWAALTIILVILIFYLILYLIGRKKKKDN